MQIFPIAAAHILLPENLKMNKKSVGKGTKILKNDGRKEPQKI